MNIELYIENQLADTGPPESLGVTLKRQFINPAELNTKDAQKSYTITLPATDRNNRIFGMLNVEERQGKFVRVYDARLVAGGITVLDGKFRLSEITADAYKGNLGVPAPRTVKDIFGDATMNKAGSGWMLEMTDFVADVNRYNAMQQPDAFFPLVLYGLLPKYMDEETGRYSSKNVIDDSTFVDKRDLPPSINCLQTIRRLFEARGYRIDGTAFADERLAGLYMSYHNPDDYPQYWGDLDRVTVKGNWRNYDSTQKEGSRIEKVVVRNGPNTADFVADILGGTNTRLEESLTYDPENNLKPEEQYGRHILIQEDGYYRIRLKASIRLIDGLFFTQASGNSSGLLLPDINIVPYYREGRTAIQSATQKERNLKNNPYEVKLLRHSPTLDLELDLAETGTDKVFYKNNIEQLPDWDSPNPSPDKYFPRPGGLLFVDQKQNPHFLCGLGWGEHDKSNTHKEHNYIDGWSYPTPEGGTEKREVYAQAMALKGGKSWDIEGLEDNKILPSLAYSPGYCDQLGEPTQYYATEMDNPPAEPYCFRDPDNDLLGEGEVEMTVFLHGGDRLYLVSHTNRYDNYWTAHEVDYLLDVQLYKAADSAYLTYDDNGFLKNKPDWAAPSDFEVGAVDLFRFLPSDTKANDWLDYFCRTFNLSLGQADAQSFRLDANQRESQQSLLPAIGLDDRAAAVRRTNTPLGLPAGYRLRFASEEDEEGYYQFQEGNQPDGSGAYSTGMPPEITTEIREVESPFAYNWFRRMSYHAFGEKEEVWLPVISPHEAWGAGTADYEEMLGKKGTGYAQRFWYKVLHTPGGVLTGSYLSLPYAASGRRICPARVTNANPEGRRLVLDYAATPDSITGSYFRLMTGIGNSYTAVECYLTPAEYSRLGDSTVCLNGDQYYVAEVDGYDPLMRKPCTLRLIRKTV